jgi:cell shape-determining protein MreD
MVFVYYFTLHTNMPHQVIYYCVLGVLNDSLYDIPLGQSCFLMIGSYYFLKAQKKYLNFNNFYFCWGSFFVFVTFINILEWCMLMQKIGIYLPWQPYLPGIFVTAFAYPFIVWLLQLNDKQPSPLSGGQDSSCSL